MAAIDIAQGVHVPSGSSDGKGMLEAPIAAAHARGLTRLEYVNYVEQDMTSVSDYIVEISPLLSAQRFDQERIPNMRMERKLLWEKILSMVFLAFLVCVKDVAAQDHSDSTRKPTPTLTARPQPSTRDILARAESLYAQGQVNAARQILAPIVQDGSTDPRVLTLYAFTLAASQRFAESEALFRQVLQDDSTSIAALLGIGMIQRATAQYDAARDTYTKAVQIAPDNDEARTLLERVRWERRTEVSVLGGQTSTDAQRGADWIGSIRTRYSPRMDLSFTFGRHELQQISTTIGAVTPIGDASETQVQSGVIVRPNDRITITTTAIYRTSRDGNSYMLWPEAVVAFKGPVSIVFGMRPGYDEITHKWSNAVEVGAAIQLPKEQGLTLRMLQTSRRDFEPPVTVLANYEAFLAPRIRLRAGAAHGNGTVFRFTSVSGGITGMIVPGVGVTLEFGQRTGTFARRNALGGLVIGF